MHRDHEIFTSAIHSRHKVLLTFLDRIDRSHQMHVCAPIDFGLSYRSEDNNSYYYFFDYDSKSCKTRIELLTDEIVTIVRLDQQFDPAPFLRPDRREQPWSTPRDWGEWR